MKLALAYSTRDQVELTKQTWPILDKSKCFKWWIDGSTDHAAIEYASLFEGYIDINIDYGIKGGADAAIVYKLSKLLNELPADYTHIGLIENDVLLDPDWLEPTMQLFEKGKADGLDVGAVSPRSYVDRILIQHDQYAVMHNLGAGVVIFTREAAEIVLRTFRTHWWPDNVRLFAQISGIDLRTYAAFRGNEQWVTTDWGWEAQLARHGLASLALTPARCQMVGQNPPLEEQGLHLTGRGVVIGRWQGYSGKFDDDRAFIQYRNALAYIRRGDWKLDSPNIIFRQNGGMLFFPHQLGHLAGFTPWQGNLELSWTQGFGPFAYRAGPGGASLSLRVSGTSSFLATGGDAGARVTITDTRSGFRTDPDLPAGANMIDIQVPGGPIPRVITLDMAEGAVFNGLQTAEPQMLDTTFRFDWLQLPEAK